MSRVALDKAGRVLVRKLDALVGRVIPLQPVLDAMSARPYELHLELGARMVPFAGYAMPVQYPSR